MSRSHFGVDDRRCLVDAVRAGAGRGRGKLRHALHKPWGSAMFTIIEMQSLADSKRDKAVRARRWAYQLATLEDQRRLLRLADELDADASDLERQADLVTVAGSSASS